MRGIETIRRETSDDQTSDIRYQTGSVACGVCSTDGRWYGGGRFLDFARNDGNKIVLRFEGDRDNPARDVRRPDFRRLDDRR